MKKTLKIFLLLIAIVVAGTLVASCIFAWNAYREIQADTCEIVSTQMFENDLQEKSVPVGESVQISVEVKTSFAFEQDLKFAFELPAGIEAAENVAQNCEISNGAFLHSLNFSLIPFRAGEFENAKIKIIATRSGTIETKELSVELPKITADLPELSAGEKLELAESLQPPSLAEKSSWIFLISAFVLLALAGTLVVILTRIKSRKPEKIIEPWTFANGELATLKSDVQSGKTGAMLAVAKISDIVRHYLSKRFSLKADAMTSQEFFKSMERHDSPLAETHKQFLQEFLTSADMIKFAGVAATNDLVLDAIDRAGTLVKETVPVAKGETK